MQKYFNSITNRAGDAIQGATISVTTIAGANAVLYLDNGITLRTSQLVTDINGYFEFYAADGRYNIGIAGVGIAPYSITDVLLEDAQTKLSELSSVLDFYIAGESDNTGMFNRATAAARRVYAPAGNYTVANANFPANTEIFGDGEDVTIINQKSGAAYAFTCDSGSSNVANNITGLRLTNLQLRGTCDTDGFSEFHHLLSLNGVTDVKIRYCKFKGFQGDGFYLGSSNTGGQERHNTRVSLYSVTIDGINNQNRNGFSIIDCDGFDADRIYFANCTKTGEPGPIDAEPDAAYNIIRNIKIGRIQCYNCGGAGAVNLNTTATALTNPVSGFEISDSYFDPSNSFSGAAIFLSTVEATATVADMGIVISRNRSKVVGEHFALRNISGLTMEDNVFMGGGISEIGASTVAALSVKNAQLNNNRFMLTGDTTGQLSIGSVENLSLDGNTFKPSDTAGHIHSIVFYGNGVTTTSTNVTLTRNRFIKGASQTDAVKTVGHTYNTPLVNIFEENIVDSGMANDFQHQGDVNWPVVLTASTPGDLSVEYSAQIGKIVKVGRRVTATFNVVTTTWSFTTATGVLRFTGLPYAASSAEDSYGAIYGSGWTLAGVSNLAARVPAGTSFVQIAASISGGALSAITPATCNSGTQQNWSGTVTYFTDQ